MSKKDTRTGDRHTQAGRLVRAPRELWDAVDAAAQARGINRSEAIRLALWEWVASQETTERRAVEAAARANHGRTHEGEFRWDLEAEGVKQGFREFFRPVITAALSAVVPSIQAEALRKYADKQGDGPTGVVFAMLLCHEADRIEAGGDL